MKQHQRQRQVRYSDSAYWPDQVLGGRNFASLVEDIYAAALDSTQWTNVLARIVEFVGGQAGGIRLQERSDMARFAAYDELVAGQKLRIRIDAGEKSGLAGRRQMGNCLHLLRLACRCDWLSA